MLWPPLEPVFIRPSWFNSPPGLALLLRCHAEGWRHILVSRAYDTANDSRVGRSSHQRGHDILGLADRGFKATSGRVDRTAGPPRHPTTSSLEKEKVEKFAPSCVPASRSRASHPPSHNTQLFFLSSVALQQKSANRRRTRLDEARWNGSGRVTLTAIALRSSFDTRVLRITRERAQHHASMPVSLCPSCLTSRARSVLWLKAHVFRAASFSRVLFGYLL